jgi:hypothetical protein
MPLTLARSVPMADALYPQQLVVHTDELGVTIVSASPGPAGVSAYTFANGTRWEIDHAEPALLAEVSVDAPHDLTDNIVVEQCVGSDRVAILAGLTTGHDGKAKQLPATTLRPRRDFMTTARPVGSPVAERAGVAVQLFDLADDVELSPLARLAAAIELLSRASQYDDLPMVDELLEDTARMAEALMAEVDDEDLDSLAANDPATADRLAQALRRALRRDYGTTFRSPLGDLDLSLRSAIDAAQNPQVAAALPMMRAPSAAASMVPTRMIAGGALPTLAEARDTRMARDLHVELPSPTRLRVTVPEGTEAEWVRVMRRDGLALIALVPLGNTGVELRADAPVPPGTRLQDLVVELSDNPVPLAPRSNAALIAVAVQQGRRACRLERRGDRAMAAKAWSECATTWRDLGDAERAELAERYRSQVMDGMRSGTPFIADQLVS